MNLVTPKSTTQLQLLFNNPEADLLNQNLSLARALGVTKIINVKRDSWY